MSDFDENPFADPSVQSATQAARQSQNAALEDYDPFGGGGVAGVSVNGVTPTMTTTTSPAVMQPVNVEAPPPPPPAYQPTPAQRIDTEDLRRRQEELDRKAAELQQREQELLRQQNMASSGGGVIRANNWPPLPSWFPLQPCFYQDFQVEIPIEFQRIVKMTYYLWMFHFGVLFMNVLGGLSYFIAEAQGTVFGLGVLYLILFTPCSFICWYRPLYKAFRNDSSFNFMLFFFVFAVQSVASVIQAIGFSSLGTCGFINSIGEFSGNVGAAIVMLFVAIGFAAAAAADILLIIRVHRIYRSSGASMSKAKEEFTTEVMANKNVQGFAADAATAAARNAMSNTAAPPAAGTPGNRF